MKIVRSFTQLFFIRDLPTYEVLVTNVTLNHNIDTSKTSFLKKNGSIHISCTQNIETDLLPMIKSLQESSQHGSSKIITGTHLYNNLFKSQNNKDFLLQRRRPLLSLSSRFHKLFSYTSLVIKKSLKYYYFLSLIPQQ